MNNTNNSNANSKLRKKKPSKNRSAQMYQPRFESSLQSQLASQLPAQLESLEFEGTSGYGAPPMHILNNMRKQQAPKQFPFNINAQPFVPAVGRPSNQLELVIPGKIKFHQEEIERESQDKEYANLRERLIAQLTQETYECMICSEQIKRFHWTWSCTKCFAIFHFNKRQNLSCITKWALKSNADPENITWRCPGCQNITAGIPENYQCFCGKEVQPRTNRNDTPHSCGKVCEKLRSAHCTHPCTDPCHPGPCPTCPTQITQTCLCARHKRKIACGAVTSGEIYKCEEVCSVLLNCSLHTCNVVCHAGECKPCEKTVEHTCYCGRETKLVPCTVKNRAELRYVCAQRCQQLYECGKHQCEAKCHPPLSDTSNCGSCPYDPKNLRYCACGQTKLTDLDTIHDRTFCTDQLPTCDKICNRQLGCGDINDRHRCEAKCHVGDCPPCRKVTMATCRCGNSQESVECTQLIELNNNNQTVLCSRRCKAWKTCGLHKCKQLCCVDEEHLCTQMCDKPLSCGNHRCELICHSGNCPRCMQTSFEEQTCICGAFVRLPPIECGTPLPVCTEPCTRQHDCDHPVRHNCHSEERCPPCVELVSRYCYGNHELRKNVFCYLNGITCGRKCNKLLPCGEHICEKVCHPGQCTTDESAICTLPCRRTTRISCPHACNLPCHPGIECDGNKQEDCQIVVVATCKCGAMRKSMKCCAIERMRKRAEAARNDSLVVVKQSEAARLACLSCDDECVKSSRNREMARALQLKDGDRSLTDIRQEISSQIIYTSLLKNYAREKPKFAQSVQDALVCLVKRASKARSPATTYHFAPMKREDRQFIHEYAAYFKVTHEPLDQEPNRSIMCTAFKNESIIPSRLLLATSNKEIGMTNNDQ